MTAWVCSASLSSRVPLASLLSLVAFAFDNSQLELLANSRNALHLVTCAFSFACQGAANTGASLPCLSRTSDKVLAGSPAVPQPPWLMQLGACRAKPISRSKGGITGLLRTPPRATEAIANWSIGWHRGTLGPCPSALSHSLLEAVCVTVVEYPVLVRSEISWKASATRIVFLTP